MGKTPEIISCLIDLSPIERTLGRVDKMYMKLSISQHRQDLQLGENLLVLRCEIKEINCQK